MTSVILISIVFIGNGILFAALGLPLMRRSIAPNAWYGFRTKRTLSDERVWYAVNEVAGRDMVIGGAILAAVAIAVLIAGASLAPVAAVAILAGAMILVVTWMVIHGFAALRRFH